MQKLCEITERHSLGCLWQGPSVWVGRRVGLYRIAHIIRYMKLLIELESYVGILCIYDQRILVPPAVGASA
jgi:hypothetical protein